MVGASDDWPNGRLRHTCSGKLLDDPNGICYVEIKKCLTV